RGAEREPSPLRERRGRGVPAAAREPELHRAPGRVDGDGEPDRGRPARLQRGGPGLQHLYPTVPPGHHGEGDRGGAERAVPGAADRDGGAAGGVPELSVRVPGAAPAPRPSTAAFVPTPSAAAASVDGPATVLAASSSAGD